MTNSIARLRAAAQAIVKSAKPVAPKGQFVIGEAEICELESAVRAYDNSAPTSVEAKSDGWLPIEMAPRNETKIERWHRIFKCVVTVERNNGRIPGYPEWVTGTKDQTWPETAFTPFWRPVSDPPPAQPQAEGGER